MPLSQQTRTLSVTPLGEDVLLLRPMSGSERLSTLFQYQLELISESYQPIKHQDLLGQPATAQIELLDYQTRYFNGIVSRFSHTGFDGSLATYRATLVPWFWLLTRPTDCRIFQDQMMPDDETALRERDHIDDWSAAGVVQSGAYTHTDFDYRAPRIQGSTQGPADQAASSA